MTPGGSGEYEGIAVIGGSRTPGSGPLPLDLWAKKSPLPECVRNLAPVFDIETVQQTIIARCIAVAFPHHGHDEEFKERLSSSVRANACALRSVIAGELELKDVHLEPVLAFATVQAQLRIPQKSMQRSYRVSFLTMWEAWTSRLREQIDADNIPLEEALEAQQLMTQTILGYQDFVASQVAETYTRDYEALNRSRAHMRRSLIRDVLRGEGDALSVSDVAVLSYEIASKHLVVLLPTIAEGAASQLAVGLRTAASCQYTLVYPLNLSATAIWLGRIADWTEEGMQAVVRALKTASVTASISEPHEGIDGFRLSLQQAEEAERIRMAWPQGSGPSVVRYGEVGLEILLLQNPELARAFVQSELGPLAKATTEALRLRETLEASFRFGSHVAAAEFLQLHEHTVRNRLQKVEQQLGHSLQERSTELQVAARLLRLLGDAARPTINSEPESRQ